MSGTTTNPRATRKKPPRKTAGSGITDAELDAIILTLPNYDPHRQAGACWFDHAAAREAISFFSEMLKFVEGPCAGKPFLLEPWQKAIVANLFGWKRPDGMRRYREVFVYVGKKNGKSTLLAGLVLYLLIADGELGAQVYSAAASKDQAALVFGECVGMIRAEPELRSRLRIYGEHGGGITRSIVYPAMHSSYKCLSSDFDSADGVNPSAAAVDEIHRHKKGDLIEVLRKGMKARAQPVMVYTTTADFNRPSPCNDLVAKARKVCANHGDESQVGYFPDFLPAVYEADRADDWALEATWRKANPNLGVTLPLEEFAKDVREAKENPSLLNSFLRLHLNIVTDADVAMIPMGRWDACEDAGTPAPERGECYGGLDLAVKRDMTALTLLFPEPDGAFRVRTWFWMPRESAKKIERIADVPFSAWERDGWVTLTDGNVVDFKAIRRDIEALSREYSIREVAYDPHSATEMSYELAAEGINLVEFPQTMLKMSEPTGKFRDLVTAGKWRHDGNPVLRWQAGNVMAYTDRSGRTRPDKEKSANKIDGIVSGIMALDRAMAAASGFGAPLIVVG